VDEFRQAQAQLSGAGVRGWWVRAQEELPEDKWQALLDAAASSDITHRAISIVLERWGVKVSPIQVGHWRRTHARAGRQ